MDSSSLIFFAIFLLLVFVAVKKLYWTERIAPEVLSEKHVVVTGGSSGIGKSAALEAARLGAHVTVIARDVQRLESAVEEIKSVARNVATQKIGHLSLDVGKSYDSVEEKLAALEDAVAPIHMLINCAGMAVCGQIEEASEADYRQMMELNYFGTVFPTLFAAKKMKQRRGGHIVITGSQGSLLGVYGMSAYCSSKFALRGFAESLHMELIPHNVAVTLCLPPDTKTPGFENEEKTKPEITRLISETAGLFEPEVVAHQMLSDALSGKFFSTVGFESLILTTLCSGMSPIKSLSDGFLSIFLMSFLKLISVGYLFHFDRIISTKSKPPKGKRTDSEKSLKSA